MKRISRIEVDNFKSLVDFQMDLPKFSCLIGMNGSGKSTVLQFIDFLSQLVRGDMKGWLEQRRWKPSDLKSKLTKKTNITLGIEFCDDQGIQLGGWDAIYSTSKHHCTWERLQLGEMSVSTLNGKVEISGAPKDSPQKWRDWKSDITFSYEGSILSALREDLLPPPIVEFKRDLAGVKSLELLAPEYLRQRTRESSGTLGLGGQNLASFLHEMSPDKRRELERLLKQAYPHLNGVGTRSLRSGWKQLDISESYQGEESGFFPAMTTEARHVNDGMLRLIAIVAELLSDNRFLLFDEIENGINPEVVEFVVNQLVNARQQVLVTTHSPMILNYLEDEVARESVIYLYKTLRGTTKPIPFFSIPSLLEKLTVMGPGEAFVDTNLTQLAMEINEMPQEES